MKAFTLVFGLGLFLLQTSCGPAAENRDVMQSRAKVIGDSIANSIKTQMSEAETPGPVNNVIKIDTPSTQQSTVAPK
jgi:hypothetical protein